MIAALVLAAGRSSRMGRNKLLFEIDGRPLVAHAVDAALAAGLAPVIVVTGHEAARVRAALPHRAVAFVDNPAFADGLSGSLKAGLDAVPDDAEGALVCLGDMPAVTAGHIRRIVEAFAPEAGRAICVPVSDGRRGNPVLFARRFFPEMRALSGDVGARELIARHAGQVCPVAMEDDAVLTDLDTADALAAFAERRR